MNAPFDDLLSGDKVKQYLGMNDWLEFVGWLAVVASLVFVGYLVFCFVQERQRKLRIQKRIEKGRARYQRELELLNEDEVLSPRWANSTNERPARQARPLTATQPTARTSSSTTQDSSWLLEP